MMVGERGPEVFTPGGPGALIRISDDTAPEVIADALAEMCERAHRVPAIVEKSSRDEPTEWSRCHQGLNLLLTDWERARAKA